MTPLPSAEEQEEIKRLRLLQHATIEQYERMVAFTERERDEARAELVGVSRERNKALGLIKMHKADRNAVLEAAAEALRDSCTFDDKPCPLCVANDEIILNLKEEPRLARGQTVQSLMDWDLMQEALRRVRGEPSAGEERK